jgi:hypothetical protein
LPAAVDSRPAVVPGGIAAPGATETGRTDLDLNVQFQRRLISVSGRCAPVSRRLPIALDRIPFRGTADGVLLGGGGQLRMIPNVPADCGAHGAQREHRGERGDDAGRAHPMRG